MRERTYELTSYCPHTCPYCSSMATQDTEDATWLDFEVFQRDLDEQTEGGTVLMDRVTLSGGEPLAHPEFYKFLTTAQAHARDVVVYTNALKHIMFNPTVIDHVRVEANLTISPGVERVRILKRVEQGREATRPEVSLSRNWTEARSCDHRVVRPDGTVVLGPCDKRS